MVIVYIGSLVSLSLNASDVADVQGFAEMFIYALIFPGAFLFMEMKHGVGALKYLRRDYPYNDRLLLPSLFYKFGFITHVNRIHTNI